jgi:uncharacterized protein
VQSTGIGSIYSFTVCYRAPRPGFDLPYVLALVDVDEGWTMLTNIVGCDPSDVRIGMTVQVTWLAAGGGTLLPVFQPEEI